MYGGHRYDKLTREELSRTLDEKDEMINNIQAELQGQDKQIKYLKEKTQTLNDEIGELEQELRHERQ